jgi:hypothetical protein
MRWRCDLRTCSPLPSPPLPPLPCPPPLPLPTLPFPLLLSLEARELLVACSPSSISSSSSFLLPCSFPSPQAAGQQCDASAGGVGACRSGLLDGRPRRGPGPRAPPPDAGPRLPRDPCVALFASDQPSPVPLSPLKTLSPGPFPLSHLLTLSHIAAVELMLSPSARKPKLPAVADPSDLTPGTAPVACPTRAGRVSDSSVEASGAGGDVLPPAISVTASEDAPSDASSSGAPCGTGAGIAVEAEAAPAIPGLQPVMHVGDPDSDMDEEISDLTQVCPLLSSHSLPSPSFPPPPLCLVLCVLTAVGAGLVCRAAAHGSLAPLPCPRCLRRRRPG